MSIQGFSKPGEELAIWAADKQFTAQQVRAYLTAQNVWFIPCLGSWDNEVELSYLTTWEAFVRVGHGLARNQVCVMHLGSKDSRARPKATLRYYPWHQNFKEDCGVLYSIPASEISQHKGWTIPLQQPANGEVLAYVCGFPDKFGDINPVDGVALDMSPRKQVEFSR